MRQITKLVKFDWVILIALMLLVLGMHFPSFSTFYTHDDFFHFNISQANSIRDFVSFFDLTRAPQNWGFFRPLTTQVFYFIMARIFSFNYLYAHIMVFSLLAAVSYLVFKLLYLVLKSKNSALIGTFLYATSASHFVHLHSLGSQELGHALFYLVAVLAIFNYFLKRKNKFVLLSALAFVGALASKEFAVTFPGMILLIYLFLRLDNETKVSIKKFLSLEAIFLLILAVYVYLHIFHYGLIKGDSYQWSFSFKTILNSICWYGLWSLNLPEMLVDFVGPGLQINPNLLKYWSNWIIPIFILFLLFVSLLVLILVLSLREIKKKTIAIYLFSALWFLLTLFPVLFLPWHKFTFYLTLPLVGVILALAFLVNQTWEKLWRYKRVNLANLVLILFLGSYFLLSCLTLGLTRKTSWLTLGAKKSYRVWQYFNENVNKLDLPVTVVFCDKPEDKSLLWSPTEQLRLALSDNNFFEVFYKDKIMALYAANCYDFIDSDYLVIPSRNF